MVFPGPATTQSMIVHRTQSMTLPVHLIGEYTRQSYILRVQFLDLDSKVKESKALEHGGTCQCSCPHIIYTIIYGMAIP